MAKSAMFCERALKDFKKEARKVKTFEELIDIYNTYLLICGEAVVGEGNKAYIGMGFSSAKGIHSAMMLKITIQIREQFDKTQAPEYENALTIIREIMSED